jgi:hypothetical protein
MRKIVIGSGLGLAAAAIPAQAAMIPLAVEPAGVSEAGRVALLQASDTQGILIGLNKPGEVQDKQRATTTIKAPASQIKMNPYDKMKAQAQLKIKGESQIKLNGDGLKTGSQIKSPAESQIKIKQGVQLKTGIAGVQCDAFGDGSVKPGQ